MFPALPASSFTTRVVASVPSLFQIEVVSPPMYRTKYRLSLTVAAFVKADDEEPGLKSFKRTVPASLPSLAHISRP